MNAAPAGWAFSAKLDFAIAASICGRAPLQAPAEQNR